MKIAILIYEGLTALDAIGPYEVLGALPEAQVCFVGKEKGLKRTDNGFLSLSADYELSEVPQPDVIVVPGSSSHTTVMMADEAVLEWLQGAHATSRWTTSVCSGALILGAAGILQGKKATTHWLALNQLTRLGAIPVSDRVVHAGKVITAAGVSAGIDMALYLAGEIAGRQRAEVIQLLIEYDPQPPFNAGQVSKASPAVLNQARREMLRRAVNLQMLRDSASLLLKGRVKL